MKQINIIEKYMGSCECGDIHTTIIFAKYTNRNVIIIERIEDPEFPWKLGKFIENGTFFRVPFCDDIAVPKFINTENCEVFAVKSIEDYIIGNIIPCQSDLVKIGIN